LYCYAVASNGAARRVTATEHDIQYGYGAMVGGLYKLNAVNP
jgi:hypothetical protein